ncbi:hypothetical protein [Pseudooceanicola sp. HF7]|uniref:hypothetical protein n=1 Tax=Pseudooceanicola sp. HF7 TaxID=2721560 RepID=UPI0014303692|nr:hypothetical protein [Pseudooceanicola sp. HF7]NIZ09294.1 hypothetical protein [Pseudooceanicola sp. HF7]
MSNAATTFRKIVLGGATPAHLRRFACKARRKGISLVDRADNGAVMASLVQVPSNVGMRDPLAWIERAVDARVLVGVEQ